MNTTSYVYDSLNQLIRENNQAAGMTWEYTYDNGGNITSRKEYDNTTGALVSQVGYTYGDTHWGDLLTAYNGQTITYDGIGNPVSDGTWTYTWENGRQLSNMTAEGAVNTFSVMPASDLKNGLYTDDDGEIRYYVDGEATYAGLIYWEGYYYYIRSTKVAVRSCSYWVTKNNDILPAATYTFDENGRMVDPPVLGVSIDFTYNADGLRVGKTVVGGSDSVAPEITRVYSYVYNGSSLSQMTMIETVEGGTSATYTLYFAYDASGPMSVTYNGTSYYYATNLQGDIIAILDTNGDAVVEYTYDAWGNHLNVTGSMADTLGEINPLRYRGYVYDTETTLYYLQSRYYDPELGRFINADVFTSTGQGLLGNNMFAYCNNNPVLSIDTRGKSATIAGGVIGGFWGLIAAFTDEEDEDDEETKWSDLFDCIVLGAAAGAAAGFAADLAVATYGTSLIAFGASAGAAGVCGAVNSAGSQYILDEEFDFGKTVHDAFWAALMGGACTMMGPISYPVAGDALTHVNAVISTEMYMLTTYGYIPSGMWFDLGSTAVTSFGAWVAGGAFTYYSTDGTGGGGGR